MAEDRQLLSQQISRKEQIIAEKRQMLENLTMKMTAMKELQTRNKTHPSNKTRVKMPFVALCAREGELRTEESHLQIWREQQQNAVRVAFPSGCMQLVGDLDLIQDARCDRPRRSASKR